MKYQILEDKVNKRGDKRQIKIAISTSRSEFFNFDMGPSDEKIEATVTAFLAREEADAAIAKADAALQAMSKL